MPVVGITHPADKVATFFTDEALAPLRALAEVRILGSCREPDFLKHLADIDILLGSWGMPQLDERLLAAAPKLQAVCYAAGTVKGFVTDASYARGITVTTAMAANAVPVAEVVTALITLANKRWFVCQDRIRAKGRRGWNDPAEIAHPGNYGTVIGLIGFGAVARLVADRLRDMDLKILGYDPHMPDAVFAAHGVERCELLDLARRSQVSSLHAPDIPATHGMCGKAFFQAMPDGATFINTARGRLVDENALVDELRTGRIQAFLDVTHPEPPEDGHPFYTLPNCWLTPHRAGSTGHEVRRMGALAIAEACRILMGEPIQHGVTKAMLATMA
jgi:phosphoglycerate dehydrogenase-like enzyme